MTTASTIITAPQKAAQQLRSQVFGLQSNVQNAVPRLQALIASGIPAQGSDAAVDAADLATALGATDLATINAILSALAMALPASS
jgi:hypothetical protein